MGAPSACYDDCVARIVVGKRGQVTIPREVREQMGIAPGEVLAVEEAGDGCLRIERWDPEHDASDFAYHSRFAPRGPSNGAHLSGEEFMALLDKLATAGDRK
jgi:AbrB family looped-hinge helix DNA binding protein